MRKLFSEGDDVIVRDYIDVEGRKIYIESAYIYQDELFGDRELSCSCFDCFEKDADGSTYDADFDVPVSILKNSNPEYSKDKVVIEFDNQIDRKEPNGWLWLNHMEGKFETLPGNDYVSLQLYMPEHLTFNELSDRRTVLPVEAVNTKNGLDTSVFVLPKIQIPLSEIKNSGKPMYHFFGDIVLKEMAKYFPVTTYLCSEVISPQIVTEMMEAGDWHINDNDFKKYSNPEGTEDFNMEYIGSIYYGNYIYDIVSGEAEDVDGPCISIHPILPDKCYSDTKKHNVIFDVNDLEELKNTAFGAKLSFGWHIKRTQENSQSLNELKKDIVQKLLEYKFLHPNRLAAYIDMKENKSSFPYQYEAAVDVIKFLEQQRNELPKELINKHKLSAVDYETLKTHYDKIYDYLKEKPVNKDNILYREMVMNGLPDNRIKYVHNFGFARERMRSIGGDLSTVNMLKKLSKMRPSIERAMREKACRNSVHPVGQ